MGDPRVDIIYMRCPCSDPAALFSNDLEINGGCIAGSICLFIVGCIGAFFPFWESIYFHWHNEYFFSFWITWAIIFLCGFCAMCSPLLCHHYLYDEWDQVDTDQIIEEKQQTMKHNADTVSLQTNIEMNIVSMQNNTNPRSDDDATNDLLPPPPL